ncbi:MAG TPA: uracil-DNA glycosylase [Terriglobales bacterium]|nr:uracil-DNA glycosylase [Terriglobales bacterium]
MARALSPEKLRAITDRVNYYRDLGIYDFYRRDVEPTPDQMAQIEEEMALDMARRNAERDEINEGFAVDGAPFKPSVGLSGVVDDPAAALRIIREDLGDCTRCRLHAQGRKQIVFGVGNPEADLMFVGEGPGADEDQQGEPFVGRAGQLLNKMIEAMGLKREQVYIANVVKCRPPGNRTPERDECDTCSPFLYRQIDVIKPKAIVALGAVAAKTLLGINETMANMRGQWFDYRGTKLRVTYHPAYLLRDPRQKGEAWKDLQEVMKYLGLEVPKKS